MSCFGSLPVGPGAHPPRWGRRLPRGVERDPGATVERGVRFLVQGDGRIVLGPEARLGRDCELRAGPGALITVDGSLDEECRLSAQSSITIEAEARLGTGCAIADWDPVHADSERPLREQGTRSAPVLIAAGALLGPRSAVLAGVTVGAGAYVLAHAVCTHDVPAGGQFPEG